MNSKPFALKYFLPVTLAACFSIVLLSWGGQKQTPQSQNRQNFIDTVPKNNTEKKIRDLDDVLDELDKAELKMNLDKVNVELKEAMKQLDAAKIQMNIDKAMKEVDMQKIKEQIDMATKQFDAAKIEKDVKESIAGVDWEKLNKQLKEQMEEVKKIDMRKFDADMKKFELQMKDMKPQLEKDMAKAKAGIEKAKIEMKEYKNFVDGLEKDGLISKKETYTIQNKNGELIINDKKQPADVYNKYRNFLEKHKNFTIKKSDDDFNIYNNNDDE
jgi:hypothetical protein